LCWLGILNTTITGGENLKKILIVASAILLLALYAVTMAEARPQESSEPQRISQAGYPVGWQSNPTGILYLCSYNGYGNCVPAVGGGGTAKVM